MLKKLSSESEFDKIIEKGIWLVDFSATWCGPCRMLEPVLEDLSKCGDILAIDVDKCPNISSKYGIMSIPSLLLFKDGKQEKMTVGYHSLEELKEFIKI